MQFAEFGESLVEVLGFSQNRAVGQKNSFLKAQLPINYVVRILELLNLLLQIREISSCITERIYACGET
jgi:hypothetical protein